MSAASWVANLIFFINQLFPDTTTPLSDSRQGTKHDDNGSVSFGGSSLVDREAAAAWQGDPSPRPVPSPVLLEVAWLLSWGKAATALSLLKAARIVRAACGPACFRLAMQRLSSMRAPRVLFDRLVEEMCHAGQATDILTENCCVRYLCRAPGTSLDEAIGAWDSLIAVGIDPDLRTAECLAAACLRARRPQVVVDLVASVEDLGLRPTPALYASLIAAYGATGDVARGLAAFAAMRADAQADSRTKIRFKEVSSQTSMAMHLRLGFASAIHMCARNHRLEQARTLYQEAERENLRLGSKALLPLLVAAVQTTNEETALWAAARMRKEAEDEGQNDSLVTGRVWKLLAQRPGSCALVDRVVVVLSGPKIPSDSAAFKKTEARVAVKPVMPPTIGRIAMFRALLV